MKYLSYEEQTEELKKADESLTKIFNQLEIKSIDFSILFGISLKIRGLLYGRTQKKANEE